MSQTEIEMNKDNQKSKKLLKQISKDKINFKENQKKKRQTKKLEENQVKKDESKQEKTKKNEQNESSSQESEDKSMIRSYKQKKNITSTRLHTKNEQISRIAHQIIEQINSAYEKDVKKFKDHQPAPYKLKWMLNQAKRIKDVQVSKEFLKLGGMLLFNKWLLKNEQTGQDTSLTVKIKVMELIQDLRPTTNDIEEADSLQKLIKKYKKSRFSSLRSLSADILLKWKNIKAIKQSQS